MARDGLWACLSTDRCHAAPEPAATNLTASESGSHLSGNYEYFA
jgi:hypothetical protein